jgi:hypothetical protein
MLFVAGNVTLIGLDWSTIGTFFVSIWNIDKNNRNESFRRCDEI